MTAVTETGVAPATESQDNTSRPVSPEEAYAPSGVGREEFITARSGRNVAIALALVGFAVLLYAVTVVKLGPGAVVRPF